MLRPEMPPGLPCASCRRLITAPKRCRIPPSFATPPSQLGSSPPTRPARRHYAVASSIATAFKLPEDYIPPTKPPSARPVETRKSQLLRSYTSLLRSTPLMLIFQHNNASAVEWSAMRRELKFALAEVAPKPRPDAPAVPDRTAPHVQLQVVRTSMFRQALKVLEFYRPPASASASAAGARPRQYTHDLSQAAYEAVKAAEAQPAPPHSPYAQLAPLLVGPLAVLTFPAVSPPHLAAALRTLAPSPPAFPAPTRRKNPGYHDAITQSGLQKIMLIGGRIDGTVFDMVGVQWVGGIESGLDGLRAQLVAMLQSAGMGLTSAMEGAGKSLWLTMESRRTMMEEEGKAPEAEKE